MDIEALENRVKWYLMELEDRTITREQAIRAIMREIKSAESSSKE